MQRTRRSSVLAAAVFGLTLAPAALAQSHSGDWSWRLGINLWLPGVDITTNTSLPAGGGIGAETDPDSYLKNLKFTFMGSLVGERGPWSVGADVVYLNFGDLKTKVTSITGPGGVASVPVDTGSKTELKGFVGTFAGGYALSQTPTSRMDVVAGLRYLKLKPSLSWEFTGPSGGVPAAGSVGSSKDFTDAIIGVRGRTALGGNYDLRYYLDAGTGESQMTWQAAVGVGYKFQWGDVALSYRHLAYDLKDDRPLSDATFSGPQFSVGFTF